MKQYLSIIIGVIIVAAVAFFALRSASVQNQVLVPSPSPDLSVAGSGNENPFVAMAPSSTPLGGVVSPSPAVSPGASSVAVSIDDEAFVPATLTIPVGTTVVFTNNGQALHWPASDPHPIHTGLPEFNAKKGLATGETYSYTFTKVGTFGIHDHLNARMKGSIVVQ